MIYPLYEVPRIVPPEDATEYIADVTMEQYEKWQKVFGEQPFSFDTEHPVTPESIDELVQAIEDVCTGIGSGSRCTQFSFRFGKRYSRDEAIIMLNEGKFSWGLDNGKTDRSPASVNNFRIEDRSGLRPDKPRAKYRVEDTFFIDPDTNIPSVFRLMSRVDRHEDYRCAIKPANSLDVAAALEVVKRAQASRETEGELPVYVEIGFGMDAAAIRGNRKFDKRQYIGFDAVVGHYALEGDTPYPDALREEVETLNRRVASERPGEHIQFNVADGENLDLPDGSVREVFMSNVLNAPDILLAAKRKLISESARVLEKGGRLVVRVNWHQDDWTPRMVTALLEDSNMWVINAAAPGDAIHRTLEKQYGTPQTVQAPEGYYMICMPIRQR